MTDLELAEEIEEAAEHGDRGYARVWFTANGDLQIRCRNSEEIQAIIAALRRGPEQIERIVRLQEASAKDKDRIQELEQANTVLQVKNVMLESKRPLSGEMVMVGNCPSTNQACPHPRQCWFSTGCPHSAAEAEGRKT